MNLSSSTSILDPSVSLAKPDALVMPRVGWQWVAAQTMARSEKKLGQFCQAEKIPVYLPVLVRVHRYGGRLRSFDSPLFTGYVFCLEDKNYPERIKQSRHCVRVLRGIEQAVLVSQLRQVRRALETKAVGEVMPFLKKGRRVRIASGPMAGAEGIVEHIKGKTRVVLAVDFIRQGLVVEIESRDLAPG
jgi:transcription antitermination factor NusG